MNMIFLFLSMLSLTSAKDVTKLLSVGDWGGYNLGGQYRENVESVSLAMYTDYKNASLVGSPYQAVLNTGDNFYYCGIQNLDDENISEDYVEHFSNINLQWISSLGNHDYGYNVSAQLDLSQRIYNWVMPKRYYKHKINNVNIYVLDTSPCIQDYINDDSTKWDPCSPLFPPCSPYKVYEECRFHQNILSQSCDEQFEWFKQDLMENLHDMKIQGEWVVVMGHHMVNQLNNENFQILIDKYADLYVNGHNHILGSYKLNSNEKYVTTGAGSMVSEDSEVRNEDVYTWYEKKSGYTRHIFSGNLVTTEFIDVYGNVIHIQKAYYNDFGVSLQFEDSTQFTENDFYLFDYNNEDVGDDYYEPDSDVNNSRQFHSFREYIDFVYELSNSITTECTTKDALASNIKVTLTPENPTSSQVVTMTIEYDLSEEVTSGSIFYKVTLNGFPVLNNKSDLCETIKGGDDPCPLEPGKHTTKSSVTMPNISGSLDSTMTWYSGDDTSRQIFCVHLQIDL